MYDNYHIKVKVEIEESGGKELDSLATHTVCFESDMIDCSVHAWFTAFEKILRYQGFDEHVIARGACQLAFNEYRDQALMRKVAKEYDLKLLEDTFDEDEEDSSSEPKTVVVTADV
jgi:hypothetical protein